MRTPVPKSKRLQVKQRQEPVDQNVSIYCVSWAGCKGLKIVQDGKGARETLADPPSMAYPTPAHLLQQLLEF